jgi:hypothetical protein
MRATRIECCAAIFRCAEGFPQNTAAIHDVAVLDNGVACDLIPADSCAECRKKEP